MFSLSAIFGTTSALFMLAGSLPYIRGVLKNEIRPHVFSWFLWGMVDVIAAAAQLAGGAGAGSWATMAGAAGALIITFLAFQKRDKIIITRFDWIIFAVTLAIIPLWAVTREPVMAALLSTAINSAAFFITIKKTWHDPSSENALSYVLYTLGWGLSLLALSQYNLTSLLYPLVAVLLNGVVIALILRGKKAP